MSHRPRHPTEDPAWAKAIVLTLVAMFLVSVLILPMVTVFFEALRKGLGPALEAMGQEDARAAI